MSASAAAGSPGFIHVDCAACGDPDVWFRCNRCERSDHFTLGTDTVRCDCDASYASGVCTCGASVPFERLRFVRAEDGPLALADLEIAWGRVAGLGVLVLAALGGMTWLMLG